MLHRSMERTPSPFPGPPRGATGFRERGLFHPEKVVLVADPSLPETVVLARNLAGGGFRGRLFAVGLRADGLEPAASLAALPVVPDLAVLNLPPAALPAAMAALAAKGCLQAVVTGAAPNLRDLCLSTGVRAFGQGSFGLCVPGIGLNASLSHLPPAPGRLALVTQSAALARAVLDWAAAEEVGFSHVIGIGGNAAIGFAMALDWLSRDSATSAVLLDLRQIRNRRAFISAARATARSRPVVAIRAGAGHGIADAVMEAALRRAGVLRVNGLEDLLAAAETLARVRPRPGGGSARGDRIALVTNGTGFGELATDAILAGGGQLAVLPPEALATLDPLLPLGWAPANPLSLGPGAGARLGQAAGILAALPEVDTVVALHAPAPEEQGDIAAEALAAAHKAGRRAAPILAAWAGQATAGRQRALLAKAGLPVFATPEAAVRGALHLAHDRRNRAAAAELPARDVLELAPDRAAVKRILAQARAEGRLALTEDEALDVLAAYGMPVVPHRRAAGPEEAAAAAAMLGFPVALKIRSPDIAWKSEVGGVVLGLSTTTGVRNSAALMLERVARLRPEARVEGFVVERMAARAQELRLRLGDDAMFGPWIGFGSGGTAADLVGDEAFDLPPLNLALARQLIERSRVAHLLHGFRDHPPANLAAVDEALVRLSQIAVDFPEIATLTINPLFADGTGVLAADCALALRPAGELGQLAIPPYPAEQARPWRLKSGEVVTVRPIRPEDAAAHAEAFAKLRPEDIRWRFFSPIRELSPQMMARLTQIDYAREMAFVAMRRRADGTEEELGVARLIRDPAGEFGGPGGEFAVIVVPEMKGQGLGRHLMQRLAEWGREQGMSEIVGQVLADNAPMLAFVRSLGFTVRRSPGDDDVCEARWVL
jgi:acetyltransferase